MSQLVDINYNEICTSLQAENKFERKKALQEILNNALDSFETLDEKNSLELWEIFHRPIVRILYDQVEACRDLALEILKKFLLYLPCSDKNIVYVIPIMTKRLGSQELIEQSEEVRLKCISLLRVIVFKYQEKLSAYFEDLTTILTRTVTDKYPKVKTESCNCISEIAKVLPTDFYSHSETFVKSVLTNISHQHYKIRMTTVSTTGEILLFGNNKLIEIVAGPLAERLFDQSGAVRTAVIQVIGKWMTDLKDRYSWWHKLIPLLLTGINDVVPEIREKAILLWKSVGEQYMIENKSDPKFREKMDWFTENLCHYPPNITRPNLGCLTIAQQNLGRLVAPISRELSDWIADVRVRAAQLLCILVLNVEEDITQHISKLLPSMYRGCNDEDLRVVENIELAAEYMGYFVPANVYCDLIIPTLEENPTTGNLKVFGAILKGNSRDMLVSELTRIGNVLKQNHVCQSTKVRYQMEILNCCGSLLKVCNEDCSAISNDLFIVIFTTLSMSAELTVEENAKLLLDLLAKALNYENTNDLFDNHIALILEAIQNNPASWTICSYEFNIFQACLKYAKTATYKNLNLIHPIFEKAIHVDSDKKLRLKQYILLSDYLQQWDKPFEENTVIDFINFANIILEKVIIPGLVWIAGRSAEAIRTASICCLCILLSKIVDNCEGSDKNISKEKKFCISLDHFGWLFEKVMPILITLMDDDAFKIRLYALRAMCLVINIGQELSYIREEHIHKASPELLNRLDDPNDEVRLAAIEALREIWKWLPKDYDLSFSYVHIEYVYTNMLTHLDDPGEKFQKQAFNCLMDLLKVHPELLIEKIHSSRANFINQKALDQLIISAQNCLTKSTC